MIIKPGFLSRLHLNEEYLLLTGRGILLVREFFDALDLRRSGSLDDVQFVVFLQATTDLPDVRSAAGPGRAGPGRPHCTLRALARGLLLAYTRVHVSKAARAGSVLMVADGGWLAGRRTA
jgi:hypothetical protein